MVMNLGAVGAMIAQTQQHARPQGKLGWKQQLVLDQKRPPIITPGDYARMSSTEQSEYNSARRAYHQGLSDIETTQMAGAHEAFAQRLDGLTTAGPVAKPGLMISGPAASGKSTTLITAGRLTDLACTRAMDEAGALFWPEDEQLIPRLVETGHQYLPVIYLSVAAQVNATLENGVRFYIQDLPPQRKYGQSRLLDMLISHVYNCGTKVILLDQVQTIASASVGALAVSNAIKDLMDGCPTSIIVGAGIGLEHNRLFSENFRTEDAALAQTGSRFALYTMAPYEISTKEGLREWLRLLATMDSHICLLRKGDRDLIDLSEYLYSRTGGLAGLVIPLLRSGANRAISSGEERISAVAALGLLQ